MAKISISDVFCYKVGDDVAENRNFCSDMCLGCVNPNTLSRVVLTAALFVSLLPENVQKLVELVRIRFVAHNADKILRTDFEIIFVDPAAQFRNDNQKWRFFMQELTLCSMPEEYAELMVRDLAKQIESRLELDVEMRWGLRKFADDITNADSKL